MNAFLSIVSAIFGAARVVGFKSKAYQAFAHLWVGFLIGGSFYDRGHLFLPMAVGLTVVEVIMFVFQKFSAIPSDER